MSGKGFDPKCGELADYFLEGKTWPAASLGEAAAMKLQARNELAQDIQDAIESYMDWHER